MLISQKYTIAINYGKCFNFILCDLFHQKLKETSIRIFFFFVCIQIWVAPPGLLLCWAIHTIWYVWYLYTWTCVKAESGDAAHHGISAPKAPKRDFKMPKFRITAISGKDANRSVKASKLDRWLNRFLLFTVRDVWSFSYPKFFGSLRLRQRPHRGAISARIDPVHIKKNY